MTLIWANDGWCYIPQRKLRRKLTETGCLSQPWDGVIAIPEYIEETTWQESEEAFQLKTSNPDNHKKTPRQRVRRQPPQQP